MKYYLLRHQYRDKGFIDGDVVFSPPLPGYYRVGMPLATGGLAVHVKLDKLVKRLNVDFFLTTSGAFFASEELAALLQRYQDDLRTVPAQTCYHNGKLTEKSYRLVHADQLLECFDYRNSLYAGKPLVLRRLEQGENPNSFLVKGVRSIAIDEARVGNANFFFMKNVLLIDPVVSEVLVEAIRKEAFSVRVDAAAG